MFMRNSIPRKLLSCVLLLVVLTITIHCVHENALAMQSTLSAAGEVASFHQVSAPQQCPCNPLHHHKDYDGCDTCEHCACQAHLAIQPFQISYITFLLDLHTIDPFKFLPEVYLSLFVPPQNLA